MSSAIAQRQAYAIVKNAYSQKGRNPVTTASDLRSIVPVVTGKTNYTFPIIVGDDTNNYAEGILLNRADSYTAIEAAIWIGKKSSATDLTYDWFSYPNATEFGNDADTFKVLFNHSILNATINNVQYLQNFSTSRFRSAPITQNGQGFGAVATTGAVVSTTTDSWTPSSGFYSLTPTLQISGTSKVELSLQLPTGLTAATGGAVYVICLALRGFLSLGASNLNK